MRRYLLLTILALISLSTNANQSIEQQLQRQALNQQSQQRIDDLDAKRQQVSQQTRGVKQQLALVKQYNQHLGAMVAQQQQELSQLQQDIASLDDTEQQALPLVHSMLQELKLFITQDLPFLQQQRLQSIARLELLLDRADVSLAEKYRQVLEAYQIEMEYGESIAAYQGPLAEQQVNYFRLGRTAWYYQTLNGHTSALWDPKQQQWQALNQADNLALGDALAIAWQQQAPRLLSLPLNQLEQGATDANP
ncbi:MULTISPECIES: DUF3450 domain-containing protein [unclassified Agarivorans]|uniref:DUF3450 domain-containing protein n=1 Tax=unclassified Agarivorans TaxID=2636026 RepID=UPI0026E49529|nr:MULTISPECIES: DUF3450 domain-containing protein [unclassified Agarivorans]MDO6685312.1 DUF3450 domain-containing protein [Agarivorans sp. 3_MG-2023]MDO6715516.1 DUF3450 domain-containing protein [Agarivorans sp. 2_MG-2023]